MRVSVVIPVYNAQSYVREAVESALAQPQTVEVLLVEDGSPDDSLQVCEALAAEYPERVRLLRHPGGANRGAGPSRNLGITHATAPYIAFLDADDFYLPGCFDTAETVLHDNPDADGVYGATGVHFETEDARERWFAQVDTVLTTVDEPIPPEEFFEALVLGGRGHFTTDAIVVRREALQQAGLFDPLRLHQDTAMWVKLAALHRLYAGQIVEPVAMRRFHDANRIDSIRRPRADVLHHQDLLWRTLVAWSLEKIDPARQALIFGRWLTVQRQIVAERGRIGQRLGLLRMLIDLGRQHPDLLRTGYYRQALLGTVIPDRFKR